MYIPEFSKLINLVWKEVHLAPYFGNPGVTKLLANVKPLYFWKVMKRDGARLIASCLESQTVKAKHQHSTRLLQPHVMLEVVLQVVFMNSFPRFA